MRLHTTLSATILLALAACRQDMHDQPRHEPLEKSEFFADRQSVRPQVPGTVARGELRLDEHLYLGTVNGEPAPRLPMPATAELVERGRRNYEIFCTPCHDHAGYGRGMVVKRGLKQPPSFHIERLRTAPDGYFFDVMTNGFGAMYDHADRITPENRWSIVAYLRALQLSQYALVAELPAEDRGFLEGGR